MAIEKFGDVVTEDENNFQLAQEDIKEQKFMVSRINQRGTKFI